MTSFGFPTVLRTVCVAASVVTGACVVHAQTTPSSGANASSSGTLRAPGATTSPRGYLGLQVGRSEFRSLSCGNGLYGCDRKDVAYQLSAGTMLNEYGGAEVSYVDAGKAQRLGGDTRARGVNLSAVGRLPIGASPFSLYGKLGGTYGWTRTGGTALGGADTGKARGFGVSYGIGAAYAITPQLSATLGLDNHDFKFAGSGREGVRSANLGLQYRY